jgi:hypothetical protein
MEGGYEREEISESLFFFGMLPYRKYRVLVDAGRGLATEDSPTDNLPLPRG